MRTVLVTGGAGFISSHLVRALVALGNCVRVLDNFSTGKAANLSGLDSTIELHDGDVRSKRQVEQAVQGVECIFHLAAFVSVPQSMVNPQLCYQVNVNGTLNLLEAARDSQVRQVVIASSAAVYGDSQELPLKDDGALRSLSPHAASEQVKEVYAGLYTNTFGLPVVALRFFDVYGPRQSADTDYAAVVPKFIQQMLAGEALIISGDGHQKRDFIFASEVVRACLLAAEIHQAGGLAINVGSGEAVSILELAETLSGILTNGTLTRFEPARAGDIVISMGDRTRATQVLGFTSEVSLAQGLAQTVEWMQT